MSDEDDLRDLEDLELQFVPVSIQQLARAVTQVESCEKCNPDAEIPFDWILRAFADAKDYVDYILPAPRLCPKCRAEIHEKTLVQPIAPPMRRTGFKCHSANMQAGDEATTEG